MEEDVKNIRKIIVTRNFVSNETGASCLFFLMTINKDPKRLIVELIEKQVPQPKEALTICLGLPTNNDKRHYLTTEMVEKHTGIGIPFIPLHNEIKRRFLSHRVLTEIKELIELQLENLI